MPNGPAALGALFKSQADAWGSVIRDNAIKTE